MKTLASVPLSPGLYLVSTPIGNLRDITLRALEVLAAVDAIACEDTRMTGKLLEAHGIKAPRLIVYNDHSADRERTGILDMLAQGKRVALVSDAGTPLISDPGYKLVRDAQDLGLNVTSLPGANALLTALQLSALPTDRFSFLGFLPAKEKARQDVLKEWRDVPGTLVAYETGPRLIDSLSDMTRVLGPDRPAAVTRELTKMYEEVRRDTLANLAAYYAQEGEPRGEIVIVIGPGEKKTFTEEDIQSRLRELLADLSVRDAAAQVADETGIARKEAYDLALRLKD
ncbi:MAG: 16S rRNA (cytidine(1402)-2'-O)-methyltransferase [Micavibrio aeruginosavorus]|uniref:Ribosomal RNA small subunit methyltransferase I n=1 Tax=Micavibrio aeruginosavorus TaxID=349221 RepID=A0A7T5UIG0_9BACT|nr:MAG: 16S rRNA (cytidine(1402)-2'-O)-methyltransferase [Micavibrio aeruginosavorus]